MELLKEIHRSPGLNIHGRTSYRQAVRAIILQGQQLLMVYSPVNGDYKFPGGGVGLNEDHATALAREVMEECGASLSRVGAAFGEIIEYDLPEQPEYEVFKMSSYYYLCEVGQGQKPQRLDAYEAGLQFQPAWVDVETAIQANTALLQSTQRAIPYWTVRETYILQQIQERLLNPSQRCPECGAPWPNAVTCQEYFYQMLFWESENPAYGEVHHLTVLCYHLQHPSLYSPEGLIGAQELLTQFLEHGATPQQVRQRNKHTLDSHQRTWKIKATDHAKGSYPSPIPWTLTAADVVAAGPANYCEMVRRWAQSIHESLNLGYTFRTYV